MNTIIKRVAAAAALLATVAVSGCASVDAPSWETTPQSTQKLPGDSLGFAEPVTDVG
jgi:hypothetical protein